MLPGGPGSAAAHVGRGEGDSLMRILAAGGKKMPCLGGAAGQAGRPAV